MKKSIKHIKNHVIGLLSSALPEHLSYHSVDHTLYVLKISLFLAEKEGIKNKQDLHLLSIAALYHDIGFTNGPGLEHELRSCKIVKKDLKSWGYSKDDIDKVCEMILATKIPQNPTSHLAEILADADLEYLGTTDFEKVGTLLYEELKHDNPNLSEEQWNKLQIGFMSSHQYHTKFCRQYREKYKQAHIRELESSLVV